MSAGSSVADAAEEEPRTVLWRPSKSQIESSNMTKFRKAVNTKYGLSLETYEELWQWSVDCHDKFWDMVASFCNLKFGTAHTSVVDVTKKPADLPEWFSGSRLNFAENLMRYRDDRVALIETGELRKTVHITYAELYRRVKQCRAALVECGVEKDDRVCAYIPNCADAVVCMLATSSIGAVWSSTSPDFGVTGVLDRFVQIRPKVLFTVNAVNYNGRAHTHLEKVQSIATSLKGVTDKVVVIPYVSDFSMDLSGIPNAVTFESFLRTGHVTEADIEFVQLPFGHPLYIMFSSGTTGKPKSIVHSAGGTLIQHMKEHIIHGDMSRDSRMLYYTTCGWMMWNWLVSALAVGSSIVCYDGAPMLKDNPALLFDLVQENKITIFGASAKYIDALEMRGAVPMESHDLSSLQMVLSTGSPLKSSSFRYIYRSIKKEVVVGSVTGGTDIISLFAGHNIIVPVVEGEIQSRCLGMNVECWTDEGKPVMDQSGELVCVTAFPCQPIYFWGDSDGAKYRKAYFEKFGGGVWAHGDYVAISSKSGGIHMRGRSDGVLNPNGVRFGASELYSITERFDEVADTLAIGQLVDENERVILFVKMKEDNGVLTHTLTAAIKKAIRMELSARHVPALMLPIDDIPYTLSGKKVEVAVKKIINKTKFHRQDGALKNPGALDLFYDLPELAVVAPSA